MGAPPSRHGPRQPIQLGLDIAKASQNVLRLLESSHGVHNYSAAQYYQDTSSPCWHATSGLRWTFVDNNRDHQHQHQHHDHSHHDHSHHHDDHTNTDDSGSRAAAGGGWMARRPNDGSASSSLSSSSLDWIPTIAWLQFSDDRTALAKLQAMDGSQRYISLLRLDQESPSSSSMVANDGWVIVREVVGPLSSNSSSSSSSTIGNGEDVASLIECLQEYLNIEHGGGQEDYEKAKNVLFAPQASLLAVGMASPSQARTEWSAPVGTLVEVSLDTYLEGVASQTPHDPASRRHDAIVQVDVTSSGGGVATAAATVKVGNGAQTLVFVDHLLLGRRRRRTDDDESTSAGAGGGHGWKILSKTFSPQLWEED